MDDDFRIEARTRTEASGRYTSVLVIIDGANERVREVPGNFATAEAAEEAAYGLAELLLIGESPQHRIDRH